MKAIILAAGRGTRINKYTEELPKGMLKLNNKSLIEHQIETLNSCGISDISIVTGYKNEKINFSGVKYYHNPAYHKTNMVVSLMCAKSEFNSDLLIAYSDIVYSPELVKNLMETPSDIAISVDSNWKNYWQYRYGTTEFDLENLVVSKNGNITELGKEVNSSLGIDFRYIGLNKFSKSCLNLLIDIYEKKKIQNSIWQQSGKSFENGYMTDILDEMIKNGEKLYPLVSEKKWLEFDTNEDYELIVKLINNGKIHELIDFKI